MSRSVSVTSCQLFANYFAGACGGLTGLAVALVVYIFNASEAEEVTSRYFWAQVALIAIVLGILYCIYGVLDNLNSINKIEQVNKTELENIKAKQEKLEQTYQKIQNDIVGLAGNLIQNKITYGNNIDYLANRLNDFNLKYKDQLNPNAVFILQDMAATLNSLVERNNELNNDIFQFLNAAMQKKVD